MGKERLDQTGNIYVSEEGKHLKEKLGDSERKFNRLEGWGREDKYGKVEIQVVVKRRQDNKSCGEHCMKRIQVD